MTLVQIRQPIGRGVELHIDRDDGDFYGIIGGWLVETIGGNLVVRDPNAALNDPGRPPILTVAVRS